ncbi:MAG: histidine phosphatase family protein [Desulfuromonas sp.]
MPKQITLIRHAAIGAQWRGRYIGRRDVPLSDAGVAQAQQLAQRLTAPDTQPIQRLWCSPAQRARQTAHPLVQRLECPPSAQAAVPASIPVTFDPRLHEIDFGQWEGLTFAQILCQDPHLVEQWAAFAATFCFPAGEALSQFHQRVNGVAAAIHAETCSHLAIVSHGGVLRSLLCALLRWPLQDHLKFNLERGGYATLQLETDHAVLTGLYNS